MTIPDVISRRLGWSAAHRFIPKALGLVIPSKADGSIVRRATTMSDTDRLLIADC